MKLCDFPAVHDDARHEYARFAADLGRTGRMSMRDLPPIWEGRAA
jgi:hypothetical protein